MPEGRIPESEITVEFTRSSGPGGQNVNKTSTKAQLKWRPADSLAFSDSEKVLILERLRHYLTSEGEIALSASSQRSQLQNRQAVMNRLDRLVALALNPPKPRLATRPPRASKLDRLNAKRKRGNIKKLRKLASDD